MDNMEIVALIAAGLGYCAVAVGFYLDFTEASDHWQHRLVTFIASALWPYLLLVRVGQWIAYPTGWNGRLP